MHGTRRASRLFIDEDGKERLRIDGKTFGGRKGLGALGAVGARDGVVCDGWTSGHFLLSQHSSTSTVGTLPA